MNERIMSFMIIIAMTSLISCKSMTTKQMIGTPVSDEIKIPKLFIVDSQVHIKDKILSFFEEYFQEKRKGKITFLDSPDDGYFNFVVTGIQGEVLDSKRFWERVQITLIYHKYVTQNTKLNHIPLKVLCIIDGRYGSGFLEPSSEGYTDDMEVKFSEAVRNYSVNILMKLGKYLTAGVNKL